MILSIHTVSLGDGLYVGVVECCEGHELRRTCMYDSREVAFWSASNLRDHLQSLGHAPPPRPQLRLAWSRP